MGKAITAYLILYVIITVLTAALNGGGGINTTNLTTAAVIGDNHVHVTSTDGFLSSDYVVIDGEEINYSSVTSTTFVLSSTVKSNHSNGSMVYSPETSMINKALNINIGAVSSNVGLYAVITVISGFFTHTIPALVTMNIPGLGGDFAFIGYIWAAMSVGILLGMVLAIGIIAWNVLRPS